MSSINVLPKKIEESIKNLINKEGYLTYEVKTNVLLTKGAGFLAAPFEVDVRGETKDGHKETNLFIKVINGGENSNWISIASVYRRELFVYRELFGIFAELQEDANIPSHERYKVVKSYEGSSAEAIILDNVTRKGFKMYDRLQVAPLQLAEMAMKELAKLHGLSFALQEKRPDYFNRKIKEMQYPIIFGDDFNGYVKNMISLTMQYVDENVKDRVEKAYYRLADKHVQFFNDEARRRCICHGDYKMNNMMVNMSNGNVIDFAAVDYQLLHYGCPAMDILYFLYVNTDRQFRRAHLSHLKDLYHETLTTFLGYFNIDVDSVYSREVFEQDFKEKLGYGVVVGFVFQAPTLMNEDDPPDVTAGLSGISFQVHDTYRDRQLGIIEEFIEWGYI